MTIEGDAARLMAHYPRIFFACHERHRRDPSTGNEVSAHQAQVIDHLDEVSGISLTGLAGHMGVTPSTMSLTIDRLQGGGYVRRTRDPDDGRRVLLRLTRAGVRVKGASSVLEPARVAALLRRLSASDRRKALAGLALLAGAANAEMKAHSHRGSWAKGRKAKEKAK